MLFVLELLTHHGINEQFKAFAIPAAAGAGRIEL
ncbi:unnamed protein product, partial [marine sediment metagenome]